jgi:histidinol-phosphate aminotransferase
VKRLVAAHIEAIQAYVPGKPTEEVERELGISGAVKLARNENPLYRLVAS